MLRITLVAVLGLACAGCSSDREERAKYDERQQLRHQGQSEANRAADSGTSDLNRATREK